MKPAISAPDRTTLSIYSFSVVFDGISRVSFCLMFWTGRLMRLFDGMAGPTSLAVYAGELWHR